MRGDRKRTFTGTAPVPYSTRRSLAGLQGRPPLLLAGFDPAKRVKTAGTS
jgi:hypothetical protein